MKRVFLDTNILMDAVEFREHGEEANTLLDMSLPNI
jgi:predicted nucleic acid-binding protein